MRRGLAAAADLPAGVGKVLLRLFGQGGDRGVARVAFRQTQPVLPPHQTPWLQEPGRAQCLFAHQDTRAEPDRAADLVRLALEDRAQFDRDIPDGDAVADFQIEPRQQRRIDGCAIGAAGLCEKLGQRQGRISDNCADQRIIAVDRLGFDEIGAAVARARHRPQRADDGHRAMSIEEIPFRRACLTLNEREIEIAA